MDIDDDIILKDKQLQNFCNKIFIDIQNENEVFKRQNLMLYKDEFSIIEGYVNFSQEIGNYADSLIPQPEKPFLQFALLRIHEKALKTYGEATRLLEYGSASGAMARWRVLFEFAVISKLLSRCPELAEKYIYYSAIEDYKIAKALYRFKDELNLDDEYFSEFGEIESSYYVIKEKYKWSGKNSYEWAKREDIKNPNLRELSKYVGLDYYYAYVNEAHLYNHSSTRYLLSDRGTKAPDDERNTYLFSPFDLELPMQLIVMTLHMINECLLYEYSKLENVDCEKSVFYIEQNKEFPKKIYELIKEKNKKDDHI